MPIIAIAGTKGGSGKTAICAALAAEAAKISARVAIYDADPQKTITGFMSSRNRRKNARNPEVFKGADTVTDAVEALQINGYDWIFLDGLPGSLLVTEEMIDVADFVVIPAKPSPSDVTANQDAVEMAEEKGKPYLVVLNQASRKDGKLVELATEQLKRFHVSPDNISKVVIANRDAYTMALFSGKDASELNADAAAEIGQLWADVLKRVLPRKSKSPRGRKTEGAK
jgi:chromosome partitioning protein